MNKNEIVEKLKNNKKLLRLVVEKLFTFGDLDPKLDDLNASFGNIPCPFHEYEINKKNDGDYAGKVYYNEEKQIDTIHCFTTKKTYTSYDYLVLIKELDPIEYIIENSNNLEQVTTIIECVEKGYLDYDSLMLQNKLEYFNNTFEECDNNLIYYVQKLYTEGLNQ